MNRKWESDQKLTSHKLDFFEEKLEIIIILQALLRFIAFIVLKLVMFQCKRK